MGKYINTVDITRNLTHIDIDHEIYNEDYIKECSWLFGILKHKRTFTLTNDSSKLKDT